ncbi:MAG: hypothetical protein ACK4VI_04130 [Alphaproteobacteria bacterium]
MKQLALTTSTFAAATLAGALTIAAPQAQAQGIANDTPYSGAPVTVLNSSNGHIVHVPQRNARSLSDATCRVSTRLRSNGRSHGRALESQPGPNHSRQACCNISHTFTFSVSGHNIRLSTPEPQWCRDSGGGGSFSSGGSPGVSGPSLGGSMGN